MLHEIVLEKNLLQIFARDFALMLIMLIKIFVWPHVKFIMRILI